MEKNEDSDNEDKEKAELNLHTIPIEILLHIFSFLDARTVINVVSRVCKDLHHIIQDNSTWRVRFGKQWPKNYPYPSSPDCGEYDWKNACMEREDANLLWKNMEQKFIRCDWNSIHYASIDSLSFIEGSKMLATGSRDRSIKLWKWDSLDKENPNDHKKCLVKDLTDAHRGWIWDLQSNGGDTLVSGSWDTKMKVWKIREADCTQLMELKYRVAVLCLSLCNNLLAAGVYDKKVLLYDPRAGFKPMRWYQKHSRAVLCLCSSDNYILSGSEDSTMVAWDIRAGKVVKTVVIGSNSFPLCMSYKNNMVLLGDKLGQVHLVDASNSQFKLIKEYNDIHKRKIHGVYHSLGQIITCSEEGSLKVWEPGKLDPPPPPPPPKPLPENWKAPPPPKPKPIYHYQMTPNIDITSVDVSDQLSMAAGCANGAVRMWIPTDAFPTDTA